MAPSNLSTENPRRLSHFMLAFALLLLSHLVLASPLYSENDKSNDKSLVHRELTDSDKAAPIQNIHPPGLDKSVYPGQQSKYVQGRAQDFARIFGKTYYLKEWTSEWLGGYFGPNPLPMGQDATTDAKMIALVSALARTSTGSFYVVGHPGELNSQHLEDSKKDRDLYYNHIDPLLWGNPLVKEVVIVDPATHRLSSLWKRDSTAHVGGNQAKVEDKYPDNEKLEVAEVSEDPTSNEGPEDQALEEFT